MDKATDSLPMTVGLFEQLFDVLDERLAEDPCDHSLRLTEEFLAECDLDTEEVLVWLAERGGTCDCEVLANVAETVRS